MRGYKLHKKFTCVSFFLLVLAGTCGFLLSTYPIYTSKLSLSHDLDTNLSLNCTYFINQKVCDQDEIFRNWYGEEVHVYSNYTRIYANISYSKEDCKSNNDTKEYCETRLDLYRQFNFLHRSAEAMTYFTIAIFSLLVIRLVYYSKRTLNRVLWFMNFGFSLLINGLTVSVMSTSVGLNRVFIEKYENSHWIDFEQTETDVRYIGKIGAIANFLSCKFEQGFYILIISIILLLVSFVITLLETHKFCAHYYAYQGDLRQVKEISSSNTLKFKLEPLLNQSEAKDKQNDENNEKEENHNENNKQ